MYASKCYCNIFARSSKPASLLIRLFTWSRWSHCGVIHQGDVIHATAFDGVIKQSLSEFKERYKKHEIRVMDGNAKKALPEISKSYDWGGVFGHWFGFWDSSKRWFCSELVFQAVKEGGVNLLDRIQCSQVSPTVLSFSPLLQPTEPHRP